MAPFYREKTFHSSPSHNLKYRIQQRRNPTLKLQKRLGPYASPSTLPNSFSNPNAALSSSAPPTPIIPAKGDAIYKNPFVPLTRRRPLMLPLASPFLSASACSAPSGPIKLPLLLPTSDAGTPRVLRRSTLSPFHPSSSRSMRKHFSFSSRSSRSARLAAS